MQWPAVDQHAVCNCLSPHAFLQSVWSMCVDAYRLVGLRCLTSQITCVGNAAVETAAAWCSTPFIVFYWSSYTDFTRQANVLIHSKFQADTQQKSFYIASVTDCQWHRSLSPVLWCYFPAGCWRFLIQSTANLVLWSITFCFSTTVMSTNARIYFLLTLQVLYLCLTTSCCLSLILPSSRPILCSNIK